MSETEHDDVEAPEAPQAPQTDDEEEEDEEQGVQEEQEAQEAEEGAQETEPAGMSEKQLEAGRKKLEAEGTRHRNRVSEIMGEEAQHLVPCPLCEGFIDGMIFPQLPRPDVIEKVRVAIGLPDLSNFQQAKHARMCDDCVGLGVVLSGSQVAENAAITCRACNGSGYIVIQQGTGELVAPTIENGSATGALPAGVNPDDPAVAELRARGFTVFPPVQIQTGA